MPSDPNDPSLALAYLESGTLTIRLAAPIAITRAAMLATPSEMAPRPEPVAAGATATLNAGDSVVGPPKVGGELRNTGTTPAVLLLAIVGPSGMSAPAATPAA